MKTVSVLNLATLLLMNSLRTPFHGLCVNKAKTIVMATYAQGHEQTHSSGSNVEGPDRAVLLTLQIRNSILLAKAFYNVSDSNKIGL